MLSVVRQAAVKAKQAFFHRARNFSRRYERHTCSIPATMSFVERGYSFDCELNEISLGGARLRPVYSHILQRAGDPVVVQCGEESLEAHIVNTTASGYGVRLREPIDDKVLQRILALKAIEV